MSAAIPHLATPTDAERIGADAKQRRAAARTLEREQQKVRALEGRVKRLESTIRTFLFARKLTAAQRDELVEILAGLRSPDRRQHGGALSSVEKELIQNYRTASQAAKNSLRQHGRDVARTKGGG